MNHPPLLAAVELTTGPRHDTYGPFIDDYTRVTDLFCALTGHDLTPAEGCLMMVCVKLGRIGHGLTNGFDPSRLEDSFADAHGYLDGAWQCLTQQEPEDED